jgi:thiol-disulfide isomerase/thioredoxin
MLRFVGVLILLCFPVSSAHADARGLRMTNVLGEEYRLGDYHGDLIVVHFWASWCPPCMQELPLMDNAYPGLNASGITLLPIAVEDVTALHLKGFYEQVGVTRLPIYRVPTATNFREILRVPLSVLPTTLVLDDNYNVRKVIPGPMNWGDPMVVRSLFQFP